MIQLNNSLGLRRPPCPWLRRYGGVLRRLRPMVTSAVVTLLVSTSGATRTAKAAAFFWTSEGASYNWSEGGNWSTGVGPANNGSSDLLFGALPVAYLSIADVPGSTVYGVLGFRVGGGEINGMTFLPAAGAYDIRSTDPGADFAEGIVIRSGGILNQSANQQTFNTPIFYDTRFGTVLNAAGGGLRFNSGFSTLGGGDSNIELKGAGPISFATFAGFNGGFTSGGGPIPPVVKSGGGTVTFENGLRSFGPFVQNGGAMKITGNSPLQSYSDLGGLIVSGNASAALSGGARLVMNARGVDVNFGSMTLSGPNSRLDATRDAIFPQPTKPLVLSTIGTGGTGSLMLSAGAAGAFDSLVVGSTSGGTLDVRTGADVSTTERGFVGHNAFSTGQALVSGAGSTWTSAGSLFIGNSGTGSLQVSDAGQVSTGGNSYLGFSIGATGEAVVSGPFSSWVSAATLAIGGNLAAAGGTGRLSIQNGGSVGASQVILYNTGTLELVGATSLGGPITSHGGLIRTNGDTALSNAVHLNAGGASVDTLNFATNTTFSGKIDGVGGLTKSTAIGITGKGTLTLTGANTYAGATTVNAGTLVVDGSITSATTVNSGAALGGSGAVGAIDIKSGATLSPGNSPGVLTAADAVLQGGSNYSFELRSDGTGAAGVDWDSLAVNGSLDISSLTPGSPLIVRLRTLDGANNANVLDAWDPAVSHTWPSIVSTTTGLVGAFDRSLFQVDTTNFQNPIKGAFSIVENGANLDLQYDAMIVPDTVLVTNLSEPIRSASPLGNNPNVATPPEPSSSWYWGAQQFLSNSQQYTVTSVEAVVGDSSVDPSPIVVAELHADSAGTIGDLIARLTAPDVSGSPTALAFLPSEPVTLEANTAYWLVLGSEAPGDGTYAWQYADTAQFAGPGSLGNFADSIDSGANWTYGDSSYPYFIQVNVSAVAPPPPPTTDFDGDGDVDGDDFLTWTANFGATDANAIQGDADDDLDVDGADFLAWQRQLGAVAGPLNTSSAVPEPAAVVLLSTALLGASILRRANRALLVALPGAVVACIAAPSHAVDKYWIGGFSDNWFAAANWSPAGAPTSADRTFLATITPHPTAIRAVSASAGNPLMIGYGGPASLSILNGGSLAADYFSYIGNGATGAVIVDGAGSRWTNRSFLAVGGGSGVGTLTIQNGGAVLNDSGSINVNSKVTVDGRNSTWTNHHELNVRGALTIQNGGVVSMENNFAATRIDSTGTATIEGVSSTWINRGDLHVGWESTGALSIGNGSGVSSVNGDVGTRVGSSGTVTIDGPGSTWANSSVLAVGVNGAGALSLSDRGWASSFHGRIGREAGSTGTVSVLGMSTWAILNELTVGGAGVGALNISSGGRVRNALGKIGVSVGSIGTALVEGPGSTWTNSSDVVVGDAGRGAVEIRNGGKVDNVRGHVGLNVGSSGTVVVSDPGSSWTGSGSFFIGNGGSGSLQVLNGATASTAGNSYLGFSPGATGSAIVSGAGSTWNTAVRLIIGGNLAEAGGVGSLQIDNGGVVSAAGGVTIRSSGKLSGNGTIIGNVVNEGGVGPGNSPGTLRIAGTYTQLPGAMLELEIGGTEDGRYDQLIVQGDADIQGQVVVRMLDGFLPRTGDKFDLLSVSGALENMAQVSFSGVSEGWQYSQAYDPAAGMLVLTSLNDAQPVPGLEADYNGDGLVDSADLTTWTVGFGAADAAHMQGDADGDQDVDGTDLLVWQRQLGGSSPVPAAGQAPEPMTAALLLSGSTGVATLARRRKFLRRPPVGMLDLAARRPIWLLKPESFQEGFGRSISSLRAALGLKLVAIDGMTLRRITIAQR